MLGCEGRSINWVGKEKHPQKMVKASSWRFSFSSSFALVLPFMISLAYLCCKFTYATDTLLPGQVLNSGQRLLSKNGAFKLGYECPSLTVDVNDFDLYCGLGIWFANSSSCNYDFLVWMPEPAKYNSCSFGSYNLSLSEDGVLHADNKENLFDCGTLNHVKNTSISAVAVLLNNGKLVIRDRINSSMVIWQSFDYPTNVLFSGGHLGFSTITGKNVTLVSTSFTYTLSLDATRRRGFIIQMRYDGSKFAGTFPKWMDIHEDGDYTLTFNDAHTYILLNNSGFVIIAKLGECDSIVWSAPETPHHRPYCGPYGLYIRSGSCICPVGFEPEALVAGCSRKEPLSCESTVTQTQVTTFHPIDSIHKYPRNTWAFKAMNMAQCESYCLRECTCTAFAYHSTCLLWFSELWNTVVINSTSNGKRMYIRLATKQQQSNPSSLLLFCLHQKVIVLSLIGALALFVTGFILLWRCRLKLFKETTVDQNGILKLFTFLQIKNFTINFSEKVGEGGFGCVFKGTMPVSCQVAVKRLKGFVQGDKQFRTEVQTIGMIQHRNLVRLLGFCADDSRRLLVYEYMVNGSLSSYLFSRSCARLSWEVWYRVALGTARGLAYLHEECKDCIVHCDIKPDNILLDDKFCAKIADFGMAKLLGRDFSRALTTMRGTIGYLVPEWISGVPITHKADVYSYGMMLLEIISGQRNSEKIKEGRFTYFPIYVAIKVNEGDDVMCLLDSSLEGNADAEQLKRACRVACWCIQDAEDHRPMMGQIVHMLEGVVDVEVPPVPRSLQNYVGMEDSISADLNISEVSY